MNDRTAQQLAEIEALLDRLGAALVEGDAPSCEQHSVALRGAIASLAGSADPAPVSGALQQRLQRGATALAAHRQQLARRAVVADRALATLLPRPEPTYAARGRGAGFGGNMPRLYAAPAT